MTEEKPDVEEKEQKETKPKIFLNNVYLVILTILTSFVLMMLVSSMIPPPIISNARTIEYNIIEYDEIMKTLSSLQSAAIKYKKQEGHPPYVFSDFVVKNGTTKKDATLILDSKQKVEGLDTKELKIYFSSLYSSDIYNFVTYYLEGADVTSKFHDDVIPEKNNRYEQIFDFILIIVLTILCFILFKRTIKSPFRMVILIILIISFFCITFLTALSGKPAIYLYPEKPTNVNIKIDPNIFLTLDIPKYIPDKGWNVLAYPNGKIEDLQPQYTDCNKIDSNRFGLEYGKKACLNNNYPYIYWEGLPKNKLLPKQTKGWLVKAAEIKAFLESKLNYVGFNKAEKDEFMRYWVHRVNESKQETVFISFMQTDAVNAYHPMIVKPAPDSINRFYIIVDQNINSHKNPQPQELTKFKREGFTLVDWGGAMVKLNYLP